MFFIRRVWIIHQNYKYIIRIIVIIVMNKSYLYQISDLFIISLKSWFFPDIIVWKVPTLKKLIF